MGTMYKGFKRCSKIFHIGANRQIVTNNLDGAHACIGAKTRTHLGGGGGVGHNVQGTVEAPRHKRLLPLKVGEARPITFALHTWVRHSAYPDLPFISHIFAQPTRRKQVTVPNHVFPGFAKDTVLSLGRGVNMPGNAHGATRRC